MTSFWKFREYLFFRMGSFWKFRVYKFQPQRKKNKKKTVESVAFVKINGKTGRNCCYWLILKKSWINQYFLGIFFWFIYFREMWVLYIFAVYLFSRMPFKRKFRVYLILWNRLKFAKFSKICTRESSTLKVKVLIRNFRWKQQRWWV